MIKRPYIFWIIVSAVGCTILFLYFICFHDGFSFDQSDWGNFGSFFSGVLIPILTIINIYVFISLTKEIEAQRVQREKEQIAKEELRREVEKKQEEQRRKDDLKRDEERRAADLRHDKERRAAELEHQKILQLSQLRFEEVKKLDEALEGTFSYNLKSDNNATPNMRYADHAISSFLRSLTALFDLEEDRIRVFTSALIKLQRVFINLSSKNQDSVFLLDDKERLLFYQLKDELIKALYACRIGKTRKMVSGIS